VRSPALIVIGEVTREGGDTALARIAMEAKA
jgi:hypothetical protein